MHHAFAMKWSYVHIKQFLNLYEKYPELWNTKGISYVTGGKSRDEALQMLYNELYDIGLVGNMDAKQLKLKIKSIKDAFRQELNKVENSRRSGTDAVYRPKLMWYRDACFLADVMNVRAKCLDPEYVEAEAEDSFNVDSVDGVETDDKNLLVNVDGAEENVTESTDSSAPKQKCNAPEKRDGSILQKRQPSASGEKRPASSLTHKPFKVVKLEIPDAEMMYQSQVYTATPSTSTAESSFTIPQVTDENKPFEQFGKLVVTELRQLPMRQAILLQKEIQDAIIKAKLNALDDMVYYNQEEEIHINNVI